MSNGITVYLGLDNHLDENIELIKKAANAGIKRIFTSLHIPEADAEVLKAELKKILAAAKEYNMDVISDISPRAMKILGFAGFSLNHFSQLGIETLRLDDGFTFDDIITMSNNDLGIKLQLNASTITKDFLEKLKEAGTDMSNIEAMHNFFPRENTGLSEEFVEFEVSGDKIEAVYMIPGWTHNIINLSDTENLVTVMTCNEIFNIDKPDTFFEVV